MTAVILFVGQSNSGKTTCLEKLIAEMKRRGYKVGIIKHHGHDFEIDVPGKDTWRHSRAGADTVCISSPFKTAIIIKTDNEMNIDDIVKFMPGVDIIFTEGYKRGSKPKIEIYRQSVCEKPVAAKEELIALVSDVKLYEDIPYFGLEDVVSLADYIENWAKPS